MKTKQDLLDRMSALAACYEATTWVTWATAQEGSALEIGLRSDRIDRLVWLIGRIDPVAIADFARRCADRAKTYVAAYAADRAAAAYAAHAAAAAAAYAAKAAAYAAKAAAAKATKAAAAYAFSAADRAADAYAAAAYAAERASAYANAADADRAYRAANAAYADERQAQLTDLRVMWAGVCT